MDLVKEMLVRLFSWTMVEEMEADIEEIVLNINAYDMLYYKIRYI